MVGADEILVLPIPRHVRMGEGWVEVPRWATASAAELLVSRVDALIAGTMAEDQERWPEVIAATISPGWCGASVLERQGYTLYIGETLPVRLEAPTSAGMRHGLATLVQLLRRFPGRIPRLRIMDSPSIENRGVMLDVSRDRIPTMEMFRKIIDSLTLLKVNHLQLYTEHTFAYAKHGSVWRGWSPLTAAEVIELDEYAHARGIEMAANQNCFGHLRQWLRHSAYADLAETHGEWLFDVWKRTGPFSLCPTDPRSLMLVRELLGELTPCFRSELVNIGCDETYDVGFGRSREAVDRRGRAAVCLDFVKSVNEVARGMGKRSQFWADMVLSQKSLLAEVPEAMVPLAWGYEATSPFEEWAHALAERGGWERGFWLCPGTSSWRSLAGRTMERRGNIAAAAKAGSEHGASGLLVCDWGDTGHWQQWPVSMLGIAHGAHAGWNAERAGDFDVRAASLQALGDPTMKAAGWLEELGDADLALRETCLGLSKNGERGRLLNQAAVFIDLFKKSDDAKGIGSVAEWEATLQRVLSLAQSRPVTGFDRLDRELTHTARFMEFAATRGALRRRAGGLSISERERLRADLDALRGEHVALWELVSREGGLPDSLEHFDSLASVL